MKSLVLFSPSPSPAVPPAPAPSPSPAAAKAAYPILLPAIFTCFFFFSISLSSQLQLNDGSRDLSIRELDDAKLKFSRLESVLEETIQSIDSKTLILKER
ncbi:hypothetical protein V6N13_135340 [Hibiscus sabdariffa]|uniref:Uncharacterized protein n=1 Tax=Hibiscus sabdariffa TaxID=183260 RepID=A0ABR2R6I5_9ROSI